MKALPIAFAALLLVLAGTAFAQEAGSVGSRNDEAAAAQPDAVFEQTYSIELGTGMPPLYMQLLPYGRVQEELAQKGQQAIDNGAFYPVISLSGVMRCGLKTELTLTFGTSWCYNKLIQYPVFGTDPNGLPRYDLYKGSPAGTLVSSPVLTILLQYRHLWNPKNAFVLYSGAGFGFSTGFLQYRGSSPLPNPIPAITPIAFRYGGEHFYGFAECTLGPVASFVHGGLGWRF